MSWSILEYCAPSSTLSSQIPLQQRCFSTTGAFSYCRFRNTSRRFLVLVWRLCDPSRCFPFYLRWTINLVLRTFEKMFFLASPFDSEDLAEVRIASLITHFHLKDWIQILYIIHSRFVLISGWYENSVCLLLCLFHGRFQIPPIACCFQVGGKYRKLRKTL